jgi:hypothetical protein
MAPSGKGRHYSIMKSRPRLSREQAFGLAFAALAIVMGLWAIYLLGPRPKTAVPVQKASNQPISAPAPNQESTRPALGADLFSALFNASSSPLASGRAADSPAKYLESLEAIYRGRGYQRFVPETSGGGDRQSLEKMRSRRLNQMRGKIYWRTDLGGISTIAAWGEDADPNAEAANSKTSNSQKEMYLTAVSPAEGGGSQWTTYRYLADTSKLQALNDQLQSDGDWPGQDPLEVPRPSGLRRLVSVGYPNQREGEPESKQEGGQRPTLMVVYQSQLRAESLAEWYTKEMPLAGWRLNSPAGARAKEEVRGVLYFTKGQSSCLVWISSGAGSDPTSVIISTRTT